MAEEESRRPVLHIVVVGFHHQRGSEVQFSHPPFVKEEESWSRKVPFDWKCLPFMALPDGAHNYEAGSTFFHLPHSHCSGGHRKTKTVYGISFYRQIDAKDLKNKSDDVTRTTVLKSVCVIAQEPLFGYIKTKLEVATKIYFEEKDFSKVNILIDLYNNLNSSLTHDVMADSLLHIGLSVVDLITKFRQRVLIYGIPVDTLCSEVLSIVSLIPGMIESGLVQAACTEENDYQNQDQEDPLYPSHLNDDALNTDQYGLPLAIFTKNAILHPYLSLQQMDLLKDSKVNSFVVGVSNALYSQQKQLYDVIIELETGNLAIQNQDLVHVLSLSTADLRFTDYLIQHVTEHNKNDGEVGWDGSEEWIRAQFKLYILSLLSTIQHTDGEGMNNFNEEFIAAWKTTHNFAVWNDKKHVGIDEVHAGHPFQGQVGLSDLKIRLSNVYQDVAAKSMQTEQGRKIGQAVAQTGKAVGGAINSARSYVASWLSNKDNSQDQAMECENEDKQARQSAQEETENAGS